MSSKKTCNYKDVEDDYDEYDFTVVTNMKPSNKRKDKSQVYSQKHVRNYMKRCNKS